LPSEEQIKSYLVTEQIVQKNWDVWLSKNLIPLDDIPKDTRGSLSIQLYLSKWHRILNPRQKLLLVTLIKNIHSYCEKNLKNIDKEYRVALMTYFSFVIGKTLAYNSRSTSWHRRNEQISSVTSQRGIPMMWDHTEVNPFVKGSGTLLAVNKSILDSLRYSIDKLKIGGNSKTMQKSITQLSGFKVKIIVTDPPYFDDVRYAEFSEFFYSWEKIALRQVLNLGDVPKAEEMSVGGWGRTNDFFNKLFSISCKKMYDLLTDDGLLVMFFAHSSLEAWDFVINSLQKSGFRITATWPVHTENTSNPMAQGHASIMSSIVIVARKRKSDKSGYIEEIQEDVRTHLMKRLDEFWKYGLRGADLTVSAMGATLDIITQYSEIKSYTGEMQIKDVLELVQKYVAQYVLNRFMKNASGLDAATSFYLYTRLSRLEGMPFDTANLIAKSMNVDLKLFEKQGLIKTSKKGKAQGIVLLNYANREVNGKQSLIDCVQFVMATFGRGGYTEVERELSTIPFSRNEIKDVLEALLSLPTEDPERQVAQKILERMGQAFPKQGQTGLDNF
jgi:adenine-specific DNA methylase